MKVYICGKVTGLIHIEAKAKFADSARKLVKAGVPESDIVNPMTFGIKETDTWHCAMKVCLAELEKCNAIYIQKDWRDSPGARAEIAFAINNQIEVFFEEANDIRLIRREHAEFY